jgi:hypothetical protein
MIYIKLLCHWTQYVTSHEAVFWRTILAFAINYVRQPMRFSLLLCL